MSSQDFFNEVEESLRADRWQEIARKYLPYAIAVAIAAVVITGGVWGWMAWTDHVNAKASDAYERGMRALVSQDGVAAETAFVEAGKAGSSAYKALALMQRAGILASEEKTEQAIAMFDQAAKASSDPVLKDAARLKAAFLMMDKAPYAAIEERLKPLAEEGRPYRPYAREALALAKLAAGRGAEAKADFVVLSLGEGVAEDVRERAQAAIQMIDSGAAAQLGAIAKAAANAPPPPPAVSPNMFVPPAGAAPQ